MSEWVPAIGIVLMSLLLWVMAIPSLLRWREEYRAEAQRAREQRTAGAATSAD